MAEVATAPDNRSKLKAGSSLVTPDMVGALEDGIDDLLQRFDMPSDFTIPGENRVAAALDLARTIVRRAERIAVAEPPGDSLVPIYLNRLSDLLWAMARWQEGRAPALQEMSGRRLRVGILRNMLDLPPHTGYGRVWNSVLPRLAIDGRPGGGQTRGPTSGCLTGTAAILVSTGPSSSHSLKSTGEDRSSTGSTIRASSR